MKEYRIAVLPGDGIGPEIVREAGKVLDVVAERAGVRFEMEEGLVGGAAYDRFGTPLPEDVLKMARGERRRSPGRRGRPEMGTARLQPPAGAGPPRPPVGARAVRQPPAGRRLRGPDRRLAAQARGRPGDRPDHRPRTPGGRLFRQAPRRPGRERPADRDQHHGLYRGGDPADREGGLRSGPGAAQEAPLRGQGQRPRNDGALAGRRHGGGPRLSGRRSSSTCTSTTARCSSSGIPASST